MQSVRTIANSRLVPPRAAMEPLALGMAHQLTALFQALKEAFVPQIFAVPVKVRGAPKSVGYR